MLYYPFGSTWQDTTGASWDERFAGMMIADANFQQYMTPNRMFSPKLGRWMTPDPAGLGAADPTNPESFNRYAYVMNNPTNGVDPSGLQVGYGGDGVGDCYMDGLITSCSRVVHTSRWLRCVRMHGAGAGWFSHCAALLRIKTGSAQQ